MDVRDRLAAIQASWTTTRPQYPLTVSRQHGCLVFVSGSHATGVPEPASDRDIARAMAQLQDEIDWS